MRLNLHFVNILLKVAQLKTIILRKRSLIKPYEFSSNPSPVEINVDYQFETCNGHVYKVTFVEATRIIDILDNLPVVSNAIYVIVDPIYIQGNLNLDIRIGSTVIDIIKDYLLEIDRFSILVFNCDISDSRQINRHHKFDRWFRNYALDLNFEKIDEEILEPDETGSGYTATFISILYAADHPRKTIILQELSILRSTIGADKLR